MTNLKAIDLRRFIGDGAHTGQQCGIWYKLGNVGNAKYSTVQPHHLRIGGNVNIVGIVSGSFDIELALHPNGKCTVILHGIGRDDNASYEVDSGGVESLLVHTNINTSVMAITNIRFWRHNGRETTCKVNENPIYQANVYPV